MRSIQQHIVVNRKLLHDHVAAYSRRAEAVLRLAAHPRLPRGRFRGWSFLRKAAASVPMSCLLLLAGRCGDRVQRADWFDAPQMRVSRFATETECWTTGWHVAPPEEQSVVAPVVRHEDGPVVRELKGAFRQEGVPAALVWIAEVESSFDPDARSKAGAMGMFQLMPATARRFGLRTGGRDERRDPVVSARAAARYLRYLHARFGSWPLAVAAYNAGEERVAGTLRARNAATFSEIASALPAETRSYVPRVLNVVSDREHVDPARLPPPTRS